MFKGVPDQMSELNEHTLRLHLCISIATYTLSVHEPWCVGLLSSLPSFHTSSTELPVALRKPFPGFSTQPSCHFDPHPVTTVTPVNIECWVRFSHLYLSCFYFIFHVIH